MSLGASADSSSIESVESDTLRSFGHPSDGAQDDTAIFVRATANEVGWMWVVKWSYGDELFGSGD